MRNTDKLYKLFAKIPGSLWHHLIHPFRYIEPRSGEEKQQTLENVDIAIFGLLHMNSNMKTYKNGGTGLTEWFSAKDVENWSRRDAKSKPKWSISTIQRSLRRLKNGGFLIDKSHPNSKRRVKLFDPLYLPGRRKTAVEQIEMQLTFLDKIRGDTDDDDE